MKYKEYKEVDFLKDDFFVDWVKRPTPESSEFWKEFVATHQEQRAVINRAKLLINSIEYTENQPLKREEYIDMFDNILEKNRSQVSTDRKQDFVKRVLKVAAALGLLLVSFVLYDQFTKPTEITRVAAPAMSITKSNPKGQKSSSVLPDGTKVKLNSESSLIVDASFGDVDRRVELIGEAFFEVTSDTQRPFIIKTNKVETKVIGTSFNVRSYSDENNMEVLVVTGEVSVSDDLGNSIILNPNELLEYDRSENSIKKSVRTDALAHIGWKDGILLFENDPFQKVIGKIERWYDVEISFPENSHVPGDYTATFHNKSLERVMDGWSFASEFNYTMNENEKIIITY